MKRLLPAAVALIVIGVGILAQGHLSERWTALTDEKLKIFSERIDKVPMEFGDWQGQEHVIDSVAFEGSSAVNAISRSYTNRLTDETVYIYLTVGMAYHMTVHTPDQCYPLNGYDIIAPKSQTPVDCGLDEEVIFARGAYRKKEVGIQQILWAFSYDSTWHGPMLAKPYYAGQGALYKIYIITQVPPNENPSVTTPVGQRFAHDFLPVLNQVLFPPEGEESDTGEARGGASDDSETSGQ